MLFAGANQRQVSQIPISLDCTALLSLSPEYYSRRAQNSVLQSVAGLISPTISCIVFQTAEWIDSRD
jgi:hypothetical protein